MTFLLSVLTLLIVIFLIGSIYGFWQSPDSAIATTAPPSPPHNSAETTPQKFAIAPLPQPTEPAVAPASAAEPAPAIATPAPSATPSQPQPEAIAPTLPVQPPQLNPITPAEIPFATSLTVSELLHPSDPSSNMEFQRVGEEGMAIAKSTSPDTASTHSASVLEEIAGLEGHRQQIERLSQYLEHPDANVRLAAAATLGQLASRSHAGERQEIVAILNQFIQDADLEVRTRAAAALVEIQP